MARDYQADKDWARKCAERMMRTLNTPPRHRKTLDYLKTLPKITGKVVVTPNEFLEMEEFPKVERKGCVPKREKGKIRRTKIGALKFAHNSGNQKRCRPNGRARNFIVKSYLKKPRCPDLCKEHRILLHQSQGGICASCGKPLSENPIEASLDHCIPRSMGGVDALGNLVVMHGICNGKKTNDTPTGCEMVWLLAVNAKIGAKPVVF